MDCARPPIIIADGLDVGFFPTIEAAARALEVIDVEDGIYRAFDRDGKALRLSSSGSRVIITCPTPTLDARNELLLLLREFLHEIGEGGGTESMDLEQLIRHCRKFVET